MKLKAIFALFNGVLMVSFLMIFLMPLFFFGTDYFSLFWARNWIIAVVFVACLAALNLYFIFNWRMFRLLEREDWPALVSYLEDRILSKGRVRSLYVRMIANSYLITSNTDGILALEAYLKAKKPVLIRRNSIQFGIPYLLMKNPSTSEAFFAALLSEKGTASRGWMAWNHAFCLLQLGRREEAGKELKGVMGTTRDPLLRLLGLYLLDICARQDPEAESIVAEGRKSLRKAYSERGMEKRISSSGENMEVVVLSRIVQDASAWLYAEEAPGAGADLPAPGAVPGH